MLFTIFSLCFIISSIQGRFLTLMPMHGTLKYSEISIPPSQAPNANTNPSHEHNIEHYSPAPSPSIDDGNASTSNVHENIFDVRSFGATGDGLTDDTIAFKSAWDAACKVENNAKIVVPKGYSFLLQPLIFTGPCNVGIVFQVINFQLYVPCLITKQALFKYYCHSKIISILGYCYFCKNESKT